MNANDFKIGNILKGDSGQPFEITIDDLMIIENGDSKAKPIPLTEEWLLKFGFEENDDYISEDNLWNDYLKNNVRITMPYFEFYFDNGDDSIKIHYIHQLQNLYSALTNQELTL